MPRTIALLALLLPALAFAADKPNVIVIVGPDVGQKDLGCYGSKYHKTPNLDALAKSGVKLVDAYSAAPVPVDAEIDYGLHPARLNMTADSKFDPEPDHRFAGPKNALDPKAPNMEEIFKKAKYESTKLYGWVLIDNVEVFIKENASNPFCIIWSPNSFFERELLKNYRQGKPGEQFDPFYAASIESFDKYVGRVLKQLDDLKLAEKTIVIVTSTNGGPASGKRELTYNGPYREGKGYLYEGGLRVPMILRGPGIKRGDCAFSSLDIFPTLLGLCGIKTELKFDGQDKSAYFGDTKIANPAPLFYWHYPHYSKEGGRPCGAIRDGNWKYIEYFDSDRRELFDLSKDVSEGRNLAAEKPDVVKDLAKKLEAWRKEVGAKMPKSNPDYKPNPQAADGTILLPGLWGNAHGQQLRFEPLPHKNTFGFWINKDDSITWEFEVTKPGTFNVELTQGCGKGSGGAEVEIGVGDSKTTHTVKDTGGFQAFEKLSAGTIKIEKAGRHILSVKAKTKPGAAVMDLQKVLLTPVK